MARWLGRFEPPVRPVRMKQCVRMAGSNLRFTPFQETGRSRLLLGVLGYGLGVPDSYWAFSAMDWAFPKIGHRCVEKPVQFAALRRQIAPPYFYDGLGIDDWKSR